MSTIPPPPVPRKPVIGDTQPPSPVARPSPIRDSAPTPYDTNKASEEDKQKVVAVVDIPNIDMVLSDILGRKPERDDRPDYGVLYRWVVANAAGLDRLAREYFEFQDKLEVEACVFMNVRVGRDDVGSYDEGSVDIGNVVQVTPFVRFLIRKTPWTVAIKNTGDQPFFDDDYRAKARLDIDLEMLEFIDDCIPTDVDQNVKFYVMTCDVANVGETLTALAELGHEVHLVCYTDTVNTKFLKQAGVDVVDLRDIPGLFKNGRIPPKDIDLESIKLGEVVYFPSTLR